MKAFAALALLVTLVFGTTATAFAEISHVRIDSNQYEAGSLPTIYVNVETEHKDVSRLNFYLRQIYRGTIILEKLEVLTSTGTRIALKGKEPIQDPNATLIVSEYRHSKWQQYKPVPVFDDNDFYNKSKAVAKKTMKATKPKPVVTAQAKPQPKPQAEPQAKSKSETLVADSSKKPAKRTYSSQPVVVASTGAAMSDDNLAGCEVLRDDGDTLWRIAAKNQRVWNTNTFGAMLAIHDANPQAFKRGEIAHLRADVELECPTQSILDNYVDVNADKRSFDLRVAGKVELAENALEDTLDNAVAVTPASEQQAQDFAQASDPEQVVVAETADEAVESAAAMTNASDTVKEIQASVAEEPFTEQIDAPLTDELKSNKLTSEQVSAEDKSAAIVEDIRNSDIAVKLADLDEQQEEVAIKTDGDCVLERGEGETLWKLAQKYSKSWDVGLFGAMLAIYEANPRGFAGGKISKLRADVELACPSDAVLQVYRDNDSNKEEFDTLFAR
ncbi:LysM peptidoglycan-binding domain-containing protein [Shewanella sp. WXL01]|uniref:LysM peptidoglycan-binding domain-containing protein n=1 Tax=Shewanella sp. WXL01 TaxID=2709721 RepID=UPI0014383309|nr:LysM peptidoglycan-binding domain-containing protein [Shewanella sp. WXL01]NKF52332.1 LysM peptidoglycan-binding domain-containing protein [Shewanella sp. WXL01]